MKGSVIRDLCSFAIALTLSASVRAQDVCQTDLDGDGTVSGGDLAVLLGAWGPCSECVADVDDSGTVDAADLASILGFWGEACVQLPWATVLEVLPDPSVVTSAQLRDAIVATGYPWRVRDDASQIEMVLVPPGTFNMGCSALPDWSCPDTELPLHSVALTFAFYVGRYEVTQAQWVAKMGSNPSFFKGPSYPDAPSRPVELVSWDTIQGFLSATDLRLLTEAEWEYACRAGTSTQYHSMPQAPNGTNDDALAGNIGWYGWGSGANSGDQTHVVGAKAANSLGLHDMSGNVWEWVNDFASDDYYESSPTANPPGPATGESRRLRGGSWIGAAQSMRSSARGSGSPSSALNYVGFRVAKTP